MGGRESKEQKAKRLAEQLRANLHRRKAQSRALCAEDTKPPKDAVDQPAETKPD